MTDDKLTAAARRLATEINPERDLWPGIAGAIEAPRRSAWTPLLAQAAAVVLLVGASSGITYLAVTGDEPVVQVAPELLFEQTSFGAHYNLGPEFQDARDSLAVQFDRELARLPDTSRAEVEENLAFVHTAIAEINDALAKDPDNVMLQARLLQAYRDQLSVLRRVSDLTRGVMMRNDI
ncbi:MAG: hypothetical protein HKN64_06690 [Woeseiaceae bacterium]|nr:hypothetical protein [Woeseiaceae bacterium]